MTYRPMLFNTPMVCAIEDGSKTQTRRLINVHDDNLSILDVKPHPDLHGTRIWEARVYGSKEDEFTMNIKAPCAKDDVIWVRETWMQVRHAKPKGNAIPSDWQEYGFFYYAKDEVANSDGSPVVWRPSIHMPKEAARIFLHVDDVRAERLQRMSEDDAMHEGATPEPPFIVGPYVRGFISTWESTIPKGKILKCGWDANPWVWVIRFTRMEKPEGWPNV